MCDTNEGASGSSMPADSDGGVENYDQNLAGHPFSDYNCLKSLEVIVISHQFVGVIYKGALRGAAWRRRDFDLGLARGGCPSAIMFVDPG